jgi:hypothetical protein
MLTLAERLRSQKQLQMFRLGRRGDLRSTGQRVGTDVVACYKSHECGEAVGSITEGRCESV